MITIHELYQIYKQHPTVITDSRKIEAGNFFFALSGENFDGNTFAASALEKGAAYAVVDNPKIAINGKYILVKNVLSTLQHLAKEHRNHFGIPIIGLTGTNGKTTTKELIAAILEQKYKVHATKGNFNNHIGVPLTLLSMPLNTEIAVIEMGANHLKEIDFLCQIVAPTHGVVTNVGKAHLEGFGSFEGVCKTKAELYHWLASQNGIAFINLDEPYLEKLSSAVSNRQFYKKINPAGKKEAITLASLLDTSPFVNLSLADENMLIQSQLIGEYNFNNILTAIAVAKHFDISSPMIKTAIEGYTPQNNRSQLFMKGTLSFIMDAYNANPVSMEKSLLSFSTMSTGGKKKLAILGDMLELGDASKIEHKKIISLAARLPIDEIVFVGNEFGKVMRSNKMRWFENVVEAKRWFEIQNFEDTSILLKGSRGIRLEEIIQHFKLINLKP